MDKQLPLGWPKPAQTFSWSRYRARCLDQSLEIMLILIQRDTSNTATLKAVEALGRKATVYTADLSSQEDVAKLVPKVLADGHQIRVLVNCAGIQRRHPSEKFPDSDFNEVSRIFSIPYYKA